MPPVARGAGVEADAGAMKIERGGKGSRDAGPSRTQARKAEGESKFVEAISAASDRAVEKDRDRLFAMIDEQAKVLVRKRTVTEMTKYRDLVADFMKLVVEGSLETREIHSTHFRVNSKVFIITRQIEEKLLGMAEQIRSGTAQALSITAATSEIRGLLMDIKA